MPGEHKLKKNTEQNLLKRYEGKTDSTMQELGLQFIIVLYNQLKQFPLDFFIDELSKDNFIEGCLKRLKLYAKQIEVNLSLQPTSSVKNLKKINKRIHKLLNLLEQHFNYTIDS